MSTSYSSAGIARMWQRRGLVGLLYVIGLAVSAFIGAAVFKLLGTVIGPSGFSQHMTDRFDLLLWVDFWKGIGPGLAAIGRQVALAGLVLMVWKVASQVGLIHALHGDATSSFWDGVGRYTRKGLLLGLLFVIPLVVVLILVFTIAGVFAGPLGEVGKFWTWVIIVPLLVIAVTATFDLFHDYARMHLVLRGSTVRRSWRAGIKWPLQHFRAILLYKLWFFLSLVLWATVLLVGFYFPDRTVGAVFVAFLVQQVLVFARTGAGVAWIGAEVALFEELAPPMPELEAETEHADATGLTDDPHSAVAFG